MALQAPMPTGFPRQEYWSGLPFPSPGDLLNPGIKPMSPALQVDSFLLSHLGNSARTASLFRTASLLFSCSVMSNSLQPHELQHSRLPCCLPSPWVFSNSCPLSQWCHTLCDRMWQMCHSSLQMAQFHSFFMAEQYFIVYIRKIPWRRKWQPTPVLLPGKSHGQRSLVNYSPWDRKESDTTEQLHFLICTTSLSIPLLMDIQFISCSGYCI